MYIINTNIEEVLKEFQFVESWMDTICQNILHKDREDCKVTLFYNYGYFVPKGKGGVIGDEIIPQARLFLIVGFFGGGHHGIALRVGVSLKSVQGNQIPQSS